MTPYYDFKSITIFHGNWQDVPQELLKADLLLTDPPFGIREARGKNKTRTNKALAKDYGNSNWDDEPPSDFDLLQLRALTTWQIIWGGNYFVLPPSRCWLIWDKENSGDFADAELAWTNLDKAVRIFRYMWNGMLKEQPEERWHPCQKPLALMKWCLSQAGKDIQSLVDPYMGVGTTLVAAKALGLRAVGCEREERYCQRAAMRLEQEVFEF